MSATDNLHPVQFRKDSADREYSSDDAMYDTLGADTAEDYGYSGIDPGDYQYKRELTGKGITETNPKREKF